MAAISDEKPPSCDGPSASRRGRRHLTTLLRTLSQSTGALMIEAIVAVSVFTLAGGAVLAGLSTVHTSGARSLSQAAAENLGRNQMELTFSLPYQEPPTVYPSIASMPGYSVSAVAEEYVSGDPTIERIRVTVSWGERQVLTLETLRVR